MNTGLTRRRVDACAFVIEFGVHGFQAQACGLPWKDGEGEIKIGAQQAAYAAQAASIFDFSVCALNGLTM